MGACLIGGYLKGYDSRSVVEKLQEEARREYGEDSYNGAANNVSFSEYNRVPKDLKPHSKKFNQYLDSLAKNLDKREGYIIQLDPIEYHIIRTNFAKWPLSSLYEFKDLRREAKGKPAMLVCYEFRYDREYMRPIATGTIADMKILAHKELRKCNYQRDFYIYCFRKNPNEACIRCYGEHKKLKKTTRKTDDKILVIPYYEFVYLGWAPE